MSNEKWRLLPGPRWRCCVQCTVITHLRGSCLTGDVERQKCKESHLRLHHGKKMHRESERVYNKENGVSRQKG